MSLQSNLQKKHITLKKFFLVLTPIIATVALVYFPISSILQASDDYQWTQTDWSGGVDLANTTTTVNTFTSISELEETTVGELALQQYSDWSTDYAVWSLRKEITFDNTDATHGSTTENLVDFITLITLEDGVSFDNSNAESAGEDIRFTDKDGTVLPYEIDHWDRSGVSSIWVKIPQIDANSDTDSIYMYYGNDSATDAQTPRDLWTDDYRMALHLKEEPGIDGIYDSAQQLDTGTYYGAMDSLNVVDGAIGDGIDLDGNDDYIRFYDENLALQHELTFEAWIYPTSSRTHGIFDNGYEIASSDSGFAIWALSDNSIVFGAGGPLNNMGIISAPNVFNLNEWSHIVVSRSGGTVKFFVNGVEVALEASPPGVSSAPIVYESNINNKYIGYRLDARSGYDQGGYASFDGSMDEVALWDKALTSQEISDRYNSGAGLELQGDETSLRSVWHMNENDYSSGTANNASYYLDGVQVGGAAPVPGKLGNAASFNGSGQYLAIHKSDFDVTYSMWVNPDHIDSVLFDNSYVFGGNEYGLHLQTDELGRLIWASHDSYSNVNGGSAFTSTGNIQTNQWQLLTFVKTLTTIETYLNGESIGSGPISANLVRYLDTRIDIGRGNESYTYTDSVFGQRRFLDGSIDEIQFMRKAKTSAWVKAQYLSQSQNLETIGSEQLKVSTSGYIISNIFDSGGNSNWDTLAYTSDGVGTVEVKLRSSNNSDMTGAGDFSTCSVTTNSSMISTGTCVDNAHRYIQYQVILSGDGSNTPVFNDISIGYSSSDLIAPLENATDLVFSSGLGNDEWTNSIPTIEWTSGEDDPSGSGVIGYCVALDEIPEGSTSSLLNPATTSGILDGIDDGVVKGGCNYIVQGNSFNLSAVGSLNFTSGNQYLLSLKAIDNGENIWNGDSSEYQDLISFIYDDTLPSPPTYISLPSDYVSNKTVTVYWPTGDSDSATDLHSGLTGLQYRIGESGIWQGDLHLGTGSLTDILTNDGSYTFITEDADQLNQGSNFLYVRAVDLAGNVSTITTNGVIKINTLAPSKPENLSVTPTDNSINSYEFNWEPPLTYIGAIENLRYCYTVNIYPTENNCTWTTNAGTNLSAGPYATSPGSNTFFVVSKDESGVVEYGNYAEKNFTYSGSAPGIPINFDVADISVKATENWRLALSWEEPEDIGAGISNYKVYRSTTTNTSCTTNIADFTLAGTTLSTSYIDSSLEQLDYSYCVKACDSANNCGAHSTTITELPTGKFTTPPEILITPTVDYVTTRRAVISWVTDRKSDTKIAFGSESGVYFEDEAYRSEQVLSHTITLNNLYPDTTYYFQAKWTDEDGNTGVYPEISFTTDPAPVVKEIAVTGLGVDYSLLNFKVTGASSVKIYYGKSTEFGGVKTISTSTNQSQYSVQLTDLQDSTSYYYRINPIDIEGNEYEGTILTFETLPKPRISNIQIEEVQNVAQPTLKVIWETNTDTSSIIEFTPDNNLDDKKTVIDLEPVKGQHLLPITSLKAETKYILVIKGTDRYGNQAISDPQYITTDTDTRPPEISTIQIEGSVVQNSDGISDPVAQLIVSWYTDEPSTGKVEYGLGTEGVYTQSTQENNGLTNKHVVIIPNLYTTNVYHIQIVSEDNSGNTSKSSNHIGITPKATSNTIDLILEALDDVFHFL
jgi:hypothetical protein